MSKLKKLLKRNTAVKETERKASLKASQNQEKINK